MSTSGTYNFGSPQNVEIITDAYERTGVLPDFITQQKIYTALRSINFILQSWVNKGLNLFTVKQGMISLNNGQTAYTLPNHGIDILEATVRTSSRNLGGTPASAPGGIAGNAFDGNPLTACTQTGPNGNISYNWGTGNFAISMLGITSFATNDYTLSAQFSFDGITWTTCLTIPTQTYVQNQLTWFVIPVPVPASNFRILETGGATLNINELYFNTNINDTIINRASRSEYIAFPNKTQTGRPSSFWVDRQINPVVYIYLTPDGTYNNLFYTYTQQIQDIGALVDTAGIPARFLEALTAELAFRLSIKEGKLDVAQTLAALSAQAYSEAAMEDRERVPLRIYGDYMQGWTQ
jgi:hypothetical protein